MKAVVLHAIGGPDALTAQIWPDPTPGPGDVVVSLHAAAVNHRDVWIRRGLYARISLPVILGSDGAGTIVACGADVPSTELGREVVINPTLNWTSGLAPSDGVAILGMPQDGTYAELVKIPAAAVFAKPPHLTFEEAAALPLAAVTAYRAVAVRGRVSAGEKVLVTGIGGGVATFALLFATMLKARVYVTSGSTAKVAQAIVHGAEGGTTYTDPRWEQTLIQDSGGLFDVVVDGAGGESFTRSLSVLKTGGRLVSYGATLGSVKELEVRRIFWRQLDVLGTTMGSSADFAGMMALVNDGLRPAVDSTFSLEQAADAHRRLEAGAQFGKIVIKIG